MSDRQTRSKAKTGTPSSPPKAGPSSKGRAKKNAVSKEKPSPSSKSKQDAKAGGKGKRDAKAAGEGTPDTIQEILVQQMPQASASQIAAAVKRIKASKRDAAEKQRLDCGLLYDIILKADEFWRIQSYNSRTPYCWEQMITRATMGRKTRERNMDQRQTGRKMKRWKTTQRWRVIRRSTS